MILVSTTRHILSLAEKREGRVLKKGNSLLLETEKGALSLRKAGWKEKILAYSGYMFVAVFLGLLVPGTVLERDYLIAFVAGGIFQLLALTLHRIIVGLGIIAFFFYSPESVFPYFYGVVASYVSWYATKFWNLYVSPEGVLVAFDE